MNKMIMAVVPRDEAYRVLEGLVAAGFTATFSESRGGVMRQAQLTFFIAVDEANLEQVLGIIRANCHVQVPVESHHGEQDSPNPAPLTADVGGAVIFVWDLDRYFTC
jgi:uncharacterized protein YaaQ